MFITHTSTGINLVSSRRLNSSRRKKHGVVGHFIPMARLSYLAPDSSSLTSQLLFYICFTQSFSTLFAKRVVASFYVLGA